MSQFSKEISDTRKTENIKYIQLGIFDPKLIKKGSVCEVITPDTYDGTEPRINGLFDPRMGVIDRGRTCATCGNTIELCPGHFGHIELGVPVFYIQFLATIVKLLQCICFRCSKLLVDKNDPVVLKYLLNKKGSARFTYINTISKKIKRCVHNNGCNCIQPSNYTKELGDKCRDKDLLIKIYADFKNREVFKDPNVKKRHIITAEKCIQIFKRITNEDCEFLGFSSKYSRPEWMLCTVFPIPPPSMRPSVRQDNNQRSEDDLTFALGNIIKNNNTLVQKLKTDPVKSTLDPLISLIQYYIATYVNNDLPGIPAHLQRSGRPLKSIEQRLKAKEGRIRGNLMGKRVDYSARTVISVDPNINIDQYGVPYNIAMNLTFPEKVTKYNIKELYKYVRNGPYNYPGANTIVKYKNNCYGEPFPCSISLKYVDLNSVELDYGDVVNRHLLDGDIALFNRQPSLHRMSMMGHKIKVLPGNTFRLNVSVTTPYNADFDGDEMNMHVPQSYSTSVELNKLTLVSTQIINPAKSKPIIFIVQDTLCGAYLLTMNKNKISKKQFFNLMMRNKNFTGDLGKEEYNNKNNKYWSGQQVYSQILPDISTYLKNQNPLNVDRDLIFKIINGKLENNDVLDKEILGKSGLIQQIHNMYGQKKCCEFLNQTQILITRWMAENSFSISFQDGILDKEGRDEVIKVINKNIKDSNNLILRAQQGIYKRDLSHKLMLASLESEITACANKGTEESMKIVKKHIKKENGFFTTVQSGSKGSTLNIQQIMGTVGQQSIEGTRVENGFTDRTLPFFPKNDISVLAKGYCVNSYMTGLSPTEFFFHAMGGRTGTIDTAVKTAASGYISRRLMKALEDVKVSYDNTVRNAANTLVQCTYGDDGFDSIKLEKVPLYIIRDNNDQMESKFKFTDDIYFNDIMNKEAYEEFTKADKMILEKEYDELIERRNKIRTECFPKIDIITSIVIYTPVNVERLIKAALHKFMIDKISVPDISPIFIIEKVNELCKYLENYVIEKNSLYLLVSYLKYYLGSKRCILEYKMDKNVFVYILEKIKNRIMESFVQPGEMVGPIGAESLGEPSTQLTLNTFHAAGVADKSVAVVEGVPRLTEIINVSKTMSTPSMEIHIKKEYQDNIKKIRSQMQYTKLSDIITMTQILYESKEDNLNTDQEDIEFIKTYDDFNKLFDVDKHNEECMSPWILRVVFDKDSMMNRNIYMADVQETILLNCNSDDDIQCYFSDDNSSDLVLRLKIRYDNDENYLIFMKEFENHIKNLTLRGIKNLKAVAISEILTVDYDLNGNVIDNKKNIIKTSGTNLIEMMSEEYVDVVNTTSNNIIEIYEVFGIEAVRAKIIEELGKLLCDQGVTFRHIEILADIMTTKGAIMQIMRHGINKSEDLGPVAKMSFEEVSDIVVKSSLFSDIDNMNGVSANIMLGQLCKNVGTNSFGLLLDEDKLVEQSNINIEIEKNNIDENVIDDLIDKEISIDPDMQDINDESFNFDYSLENLNSHQLSVNKLNIADSKIISKNGKEDIIKSEVIDNNEIKDDELSVNLEEESDDEFEDSDLEEERKGDKKSDDEFEDSESEDEGSKKSEEEESDNEFEDSESDDEESKKSEEEEESDNEFEDSESEDEGSKKSEEEESDNEFEDSESDDEK